MATIDYQFAMALKGILDHGATVTTRNSEVYRYKNVMMDINSTPLISARKTAWKSALREMEWFLSGSSNIKDLHESVHHWWTPWANSRGEVLNNYGHQLRRYTTMNEFANYASFDQIEYLKEGIKNHPYSRRNVITTWNTADMANERTPITNCHGSLIQCLVEPEDNSLHMTMIQRSSDMVVGLQHNLIQYWALLQYLAHHSGRKVGGMIWHGIDCHIYKSHKEVARRIVTEGFQMPRVPCPKLCYKPSSSDFKADDFSLNAKYEPRITEKVEMIV